MTADEREARRRPIRDRLPQDPPDAGNHRRVLEPLVGAGDFLLNLSVDVSSTAMAAFCHELGALYLDTVVEPWGGVDFDRACRRRALQLCPAREMLKLRRELGPGPTAVSAQGANPGLVSSCSRRPALIAARDTGLPHAAPSDRPRLGAPVPRLGVKAIHIAERDTQAARTPKRAGEFVNTWSIDGFLSEGVGQPAELGWGTHERHFPSGGMRHRSGCGSAIYLSQPGAATRVRTWTPHAGPIHGFLVTHNEAISISDYLTLRDGDTVLYRPTVHYAYHPCDDAVLSLHEMAGRAWQPPQEQRILMEEITSGMDELGVLLMGHQLAAPSGMARN